MKKISALFSIVLTTLAHSQVGEDFCGTYKIMATDIPIKMIVKIDKPAINQRLIKVDVKNSPYGKMKCRNKNNRPAIIGDDGTMVTKLSCSGGLEYFRTSNLKNVSDFQKFSKVVYSSLYETDIKMYYTRLNRDGCRD